jgi:hypothetical protein
MTTIETNLRGGRHRAPADVDFRDMPRSAGHTRRVDEAVAESLDRGVGLFDAGEFFAAHEAWEDGWKATDEPETRLLLQGLIQVAAGFHKVVVQGKPDSARRLLARGLAKLEQVAEAPGIEVGRLCEATRACARALERGEFSRAMIPRIGLRRP